MNSCEQEPGWFHNQVPLKPTPRSYGLLPHPPGDSGSVPLYSERSDLGTGILKETTTWNTGKYW